jgi:hypothetical protein
MTDPLDLRLVRASTFEPLLNSEFRSADPAGTFRLIAVERYERQETAPRQEPFSLIFTGEPSLEQRIYSLEHAALGRLELFLVPLAPTGDGRARYEAVFS